jgi:hypothetical protein
LAAPVAAAMMAREIRCMPTFPAFFRSVLLALLCALGALPA